MNGLEIFSAFETGRRVESYLNRPLLDCGDVNSNPLEPVSLAIDKHANQLAILIPWPAPDLPFH